jgi:prepilin-type processing-associated H-X9-DG protein
MVMKRRHAPKGPSAAFSLVELLIVVAMIATFYALTFSSRQAHHQKVEQQHCRENLQKLYISLQLYANDFHGQTPFITNATTSEAALAGLVPRYTSDTSVFVCPGGRDGQIPSGARLTAEKISYAYYMGRRLDNATEALLSDRQVNTNSKPQSADLFSATGDAPGNNHKKYGGNVLFGDGHIETSPASAAFPLEYPASVTLLNPKP